MLFKRFVAVWEAGTYSYCVRPLLLIAALWLCCLTAWGQTSPFNVQFLSKPNALADRQYLGITVSNIPGVQTPWLSDIDGASFSLANVNNLTVNGTLRVTSGSFHLGPNSLLITNLINGSGSEMIQDGTGALGITTNYLTLEVPIRGDDHDGHYIFFDGLSFVDGSGNTRLEFTTDAEEVHSGASIIMDNTNADLIISGGAIHFHAGGLTTNLSVVFTATMTTNVLNFTNGLLVAVNGSAAPAHGASIIQPAGLGYLLQPGGGTLLLP